VYTYDFISKTVTEQNVKSIISKAGYNISDYTYTSRVDKDGWVVAGNVVMTLTLLRNAAIALEIKVEITG
jgi:hypothetical protein